MPQEFTGEVEIKSSSRNEVMIQLDGDSSVIGLRALVPSRGASRSGRSLPGRSFPGSSHPGESDQTLAFGLVETVRFKGSTGEVFCNNLAVYPNDSYIAKPPHVVQPGSKQTIRLQGDHAQVDIGGAGHSGGLKLLDTGGTAKIRITANGHIVVGGEDHDGLISIAGADGAGVQTIQIRGKDAYVEIGSLAQSGTLVLYSENGKTIELDGEYGNIYLGGNGQDGDIRVRNSNGVQTIGLDGQSGDITLANADVAEEFEANSQLDAGTVVVLEAGGFVRPSSFAYDTHVAGIISGAGGYRPGLVLDTKPTSAERYAVALLGKVGCKVDAAYGAISVGDLLTTSQTPGHAMIVGDRSQAIGAILGKSLGTIEQGTGVVPVMATLQ